MNKISHINNKLTATTIAAFTALVATLVLLTATCNAEQNVQQSARSAPIVGVGDNNWQMFYDPSYRALNTKISRLVIPWDFYRDPKQLRSTTLWLEGARDAGVEPLVSLHRSEADPNKLPSLSEFADSLTFVLSRYPWVKTISPWNEANHKSQPTVDNPKQAAKYFNLTKALCPSCKIVAADVLDQTNLLPWLKQFLRYAKKPKIWGLHSYADTNRNKPWSESTTRKFLRATKGEVWLTEVGGIVAFNDSYSFDPNRAAGAVRRALDLGFRDPRITRTYLYCWFGTFPNSASVPAIAWDSGIVNPNGSPRPAYSTLAQWLAANNR